jgi:hypothetical protein
VLGPLSAEELHEENFNVTQTHPCRNSGPLMPVFVPMDSMLSWTMRKRKKMRRSEDFLVYYIYND